MTSVDACIGPAADSADNRSIKDGARAPPDEQLLGQRWKPISRLVCFETAAECRWVFVAGGGLF